MFLIINLKGISSSDSEESEFFELTGFSKLDAV